MLLSKMFHSGFEVENNVRCELDKISVSPQTALDMEQVGKLEHEIVHNVFLIITGL